MSIERVKQKLQQSKETIIVGIKKVEQEEKKGKFNIEIMESKRKDTIDTIKKHFDLLREQLKNREEIFTQEYEEIFNEKTALLYSQMEEFDSVLTDFNFMKAKLERVEKDIGNSIL